MPSRSFAIYYCMIDFRFLTNRIIFLQNIAWQFSIEVVRYCRMCHIFLFQGFHKTPQETPVCILYYVKSTSPTMNSGPILISFIIPIFLAFLIFFSLNSKISLFILFLFIKQCEIMKNCREEKLRQYVDAQISMIFL